MGTKLIGKINKRNIMEVLIERIQEKNSWGKNELSKLLAEISSKYSKKILNKQCMLTSDENIKENIIIDTCNHTLIEIQNKPSWGKNEVKEIIFKKLVEELSC